MADYTSTRGHGVVKNRNIITHRTDGRREADLVLVSQLYLRGISQVDICKQVMAANGRSKYGLATLANDLREIRRRWVEGYLKDYDELRVRELAHIDELERTYWLEYERSRGETVEREWVEIESESPWVRKRDELDAKGDGTDAERQGERAGREGDNMFESAVTAPRQGDNAFEAGTDTQHYKRSRKSEKRMERLGGTEYLKGIQWCVETRCKILGLNAPTTININWRKQAKAAGFDPESIIDGLVKDIIEGRAEDGAVDTVSNLLTEGQTVHNGG